MSKKKMIEEQVKLLKTKKQLILQGAPGTGKTYITAELAVALIDKDKYEYCDRTQITKRYKELEKEKRIFFTTFHQSLDYEEFVEGYKPSNDDGSLTYEVEDGIFKQICKAAENIVETNDKTKPFVDFEKVFYDFVELVDKQEKFPLTSMTGTDLQLYSTRNGNISFKSVGKLDGQTATRHILKRDFQDFINGNITTYKDIKPKEASQSLWHGNARLYYAVLKEMKEQILDKNTQNYVIEKSESKNYVLIIDEINRGNISKILGELITLLEVDKRQGEDNEITVTLPYSRETFTVPSNVYIIGTMNTADRSVGHIDYAIRRRFAFETLKSNEHEEIAEYYDKKGDDMTKAKAKAYFENIKTNIFGYDGSKNYTNISPDLDGEDLMIGHSYFMAENMDTLNMKLEHEIKLLLREYVKDGILVGDGIKEAIDKLSDIDKEQQNTNES